MAASEAALAGIRIVLVRPKGAANIGAVARAMKNMGLTDLALVRPARGWKRGAVMAVHARDVLDRARVADSIADAVADCHLVVGTTCRGGPYRAQAESPEALAPFLLARAAAGRVAILFGPEDHGLANEDLKPCQRLLTIDTSDEYASLNLAQAVLLCCYELRRSARAGVQATSTGQEPGATAAAPAAAVELLFERLQHALLRIGFLNRQNPDHIMFAIRRLLGRAELDEAEVKILLGLARQIEWYARTAMQSEAEIGEEVL
jgi:tRNA/rRNA methyltransferase